MARLTQKQPDGGYLCENTAAAVERLGKLEDLCAALAAEQAEISAKLEALRYDNKTHSVKFKELLVKKLNNANILTLMQLHGFFTPEDTNT